MYVTGNYKIESSLIWNKILFYFTSGITSDIDVPGAKTKTKTKAKTNNINKKSAIGVSKKRTFNDQQIALV